MVSFDTLKAQQELKAKNPLTQTENTAFVRGFFARQEEFFLLCRSQRKKNSTQYCRKTIASAVFEAVSTGSSGFDENQANAVVNILALSVNVDNLVTKDEFNNKINDLDKKIDDKFNILDKKIDSKINELDKKIDSKMQHLEDKFDSKLTLEITKLQNNLFKLVGGGLIATCGVILTVTRLMLR
jgi:hypothetical protein